MTPDPSGIQVHTKPGGLTTNEHILHVVVLICTGGLWLPAYALFYLFAPMKRVEIYAPQGADPQAVARVRMQAEALSPAEESIKHQRLVIVLVMVVAWLALCGGAAWFTVMT